MKISVSAAVWLVNREHVMRKRWVLFCFCLVLMVAAGSGVGFAEDAAGYSSSSISIPIEDLEEQQEEESKEAMEDFASGMSRMGDIFAVPGEVRLRVPVFVSDLPSEISRVGVLCIVSFAGYGRTETVFGMARNGGRTMLLSVPTRNGQRDQHGSYDCRILIQADGAEPVSLSEIRETIELAPDKRQVLTVKGRF